MKIRTGFVSNSSSTSFIISNKTNKDLTLKDFVEENPQLVKQFNEKYDYKYFQKKMIKDAVSRGNIIKPGNNTMAFGDEDKDTLGQVFDYILRDGGNSESFTWSFNEYLR